MEDRQRFGRIEDGDSPLVTNENSEKRIRQLLRTYYELVDSGTPAEMECKGRINGFCEALVLTGQTDADSISAVLNEEHQAYFGMTREAKYYRVSGSEQIWSERDWDKFDRPTYTRRPLRCERKQPE